MDKPALRKATLTVVLAFGLAAALGLGYLSVWAWSNPEASFWLRTL